MSRKTRRNWTVEEAKLLLDCYLKNFDKNNQYGPFRPESKIIQKIAKLFNRTETSVSKMIKVYLWHDPRSRKETRPPFYADLIDEIWYKYNNKKKQLEDECKLIRRKMDCRNLFPDEIDSIMKAPEGAKARKMVNAYERNENNRQACLDYHGTTCHVCHFDFDKRYGVDLAEGFIHVHHLLPLHVIHKQYEANGKKYVPNPETDLIPVCPNCHAMLHYAFPVPKSRREAGEHVKELRKRVKK